MTKKTGREKKKAVPEPQPDASPGLSVKAKAVKSCADLFCETFEVALGSISAGCAQGCSFDLLISHVFDYEDGTNAYFLPHGIYIAVDPPADIQSAQIISMPAAWATWLNVSTFVQDPNHKFVYWVKGPSGADPEHDYSNVLPHAGEVLKIRITLAKGFCPTASRVITVRELQGHAFPNKPQFWSCPETIVLPPGGLVIDFIGSKTSICKGKGMTMTLPNVPPGSTVRWYRKILADPTQDCPQQAPCPLDSSWVLRQTTAQAPAGPNIFHTGKIDHSACFVAVVECGCSIIPSNVRKVEVCPAVPENSITVMGDFSMVDSNNIPHACGGWTGTLYLSPSAYPCFTKILGWETRMRRLTYPSPCNPQWGPWFPQTPAGWSPIAGSEDQTSLPIPYAGQPPQKMFCKLQFEYRAVVQNACGISYPTFPFIIDRPAHPGTITAYPLPPLCYSRWGKGTKLSFSSICAEVLEWELQEELSPCSDTWPENDDGTPDWTTIAGTQGTCIFWTGNLTKTTRYRVKIRNGACQETYSPAYTVYVKPKLTVHIIADSHILCPPGSVTLTAQTSYDGLSCNYPVTYQWFWNGVLINGATGSTYSPTEGGNYSVEVSSGSCGAVAAKKPVRICRRPEVAIAVEPCCMCKMNNTFSPVTLTAAVSGCSPGCPHLPLIFSWSTGETTQSITVNNPVHYTVSVHCALWPPGCPEITDTIHVHECP